MEKRLIFGDFDLEAENPSQFAADQIYIQKLLEKDKQLKKDWQHANDELEALNKKKK